MTFTPQRADRELGFPFRGCQSTVDRHEVPLSKLGPDSREMLIEPGRTDALGKAKRRHGAAGYGAATGVLQMGSTEATMRGIDMFEMPTLDSADGFPVLASVFTDESKRYGLLWLHDGSTDYTEGQQFGAVSYPTGSMTVPSIRVPPIPYDGNGATGYSRMQSEEGRRHIIAGTRRHVGVKNREYFGGFMSAGTNFAREYNLIDSTSPPLRHYPTGHIMPLREATRVDADYPAVGGQGSWQWGDQYYEAWGFEWEDGTRSMPFTPRAPQGAAGVLVNGLALVTIGKAADSGAAAPNNNYLYVPDRNVRLGPPGVTKRIKYRSAKITKAQVAAGVVPDISTIQLCGIIADNTSTSYNDPNGNDIVLVDDPLTRRDQIWPSRARYNWAFDQRHACGYLRPSPYAIVIAPVGAVVAGDYNGADSSLGDINGAGLAFIIQLRKSSGGAYTLRLRSTAPGGVGAPVQNLSVTLTSTLTLQDLVDTICATTIAGNGAEWRAQLVPGAGQQVPSNNLAPTHIDVSGCTNANASPTLNVSSTADLAEGMKINDAAWPANTYIKRKVSTTQLTMSANSTALVGAGRDMEFYADTGDDILFTDATAHSQFGNMRAFHNAIPAVLAFQQAYLDTFPTAKGDFIVTTAGPTQKPNGAHMFHTAPGGRYTGESQAGILMGGAPLKSGSVVFYSNWIGYYVNRRTGATGEDADYRMEWVDQGHGCKSPYSIVSGNGWVGCWRDDGFWIFDGQNARVISLDHYAVTTLGGVGEFAYEAALCNAAAASDTNDYYMHAHYRDGRLWLNYRVSAGVFATACYDASISEESSGIAQMLQRPEVSQLTGLPNAVGTPFGWSARCSYSWRSFAAGCGGAIGSVRKSDGLHLYQADDKNDKTNCGLVQEFESTGTYLDGADPVQWAFYGPTDMPGGLRKSSVADQLTFLYKNTVASGATGVTVTLYRDQARSKSVTFALDLTTGSDFFSRKPKNPPIACRAPAEVCEVKITGGALAAERIFEVSGISIPANVLASVT